MSAYWLSPPDTVSPLLNLSRFRQVSLYIYFFFFLVFLIAQMLLMDMDTKIKVTRMAVLYY